MQTKSATLQEKNRETSSPGFWHVSVARSQVHIREQQQTAVFQTLPNAALRLVPLLQCIISIIQSQLPTLTWAELFSLLSWGNIVHVMTLYSAFPSMFMNPLASFSQSSGPTALETSSSYSVPETHMAGQVKIKRKSHSTWTRPQRAHRVGDTWMTSSREAFQQFLSAWTLVHPAESRCH